MEHPSSQSLFAQLRSACISQWHAFTHHRFVAALADGSLPEPAFRNYLIQDYRFLVHFARAYGLAAFKSEAISDLRAASAGLMALIDQEMPLHVELCATWGLSSDDLDAAEETETTLAYTRYVLERGLAGTLLDLQVALAPCIVGYAEIGQRLIEAPQTGLTGHPYRRWIETYGHPDYQEVASGHIRHLDVLMQRQGSASRMPC